MTRVLVLGRAPVPGRTKTRLVPALGAEGAAALSATLTRRAVATARGARLGPVELWCAPGCGHPLFQGLAARGDVALRDQGPGDLGARMGEALAAGALPALLLGTDCPGLTPAALREAAAALTRHDAVLVPAEDGGYVLVGLARPVPEMFAGIPWGTPAVLGETRAALQAAGASWAELAPLADVDRPEDLARLRREHPALLAQAGLQGRS